MEYKHLKLNCAKTDFSILGSKRTLAASPTPSLTLGGDVTIPPKVSVRNIGFVMDRTLTADDHVTAVCRTSYAQLRSLSRIKHFMDKKSLEILLHAFTTSRLDYCNSLLFGINESLICKLQRVQNSCARLLTDTRRYDHITPVLKSLHWLPIKSWVVFKILVIVFKCLHNWHDFPVYLKERLTCKVRYT